MKTLISFITEANDWLSRASTKYSTSHAPGDKREEHHAHQEKERRKRKKKKDKAGFHHDIGVVTHQ